MYARLVLVALASVALLAAPGPTIAASVAHYTGCADMYDTFAGRPEWVADRLPPGYASHGTLFTIGLRCGSVTGLSEAAGVEEVWLATYVEPPAAHRSPGANFYGLPLAVFTSSPELAAVYESWGIAVGTSAATSVDVGASGPLTRDGLALGIAGARSVRVANSVLTGEVAGVPGQGFPAGHYRVIVAADREVTGFVDWSWPEVERQSLLGVSSELQLRGFDDTALGQYSADAAETLVEVDAGQTTVAVGGSALGGVDAVHDWGAGYGYTLQYVGFAG